MRVGQWGMLGRMRIYKSGEVIGVELALTTGPAAIARPLEEDGSARRETAMGYTGRNMF